MTVQLTEAADAATTAPPPRRWLILTVIGLAQLMVVLDITVVNIALPSAQHDLGFSVPDRQWVVTAYALAFGGLLLVGGRLSDLLGRRTTFIVGLIGFAVVSAVGGAAPGFGTLVAARAVQGAFGALLAPSALALLGTTFTDPRERRTALGVYTALAGAGGAVGLLLGGVLTEYVSWRWSLYVNVVFAVVALIGALILLPRQRRDPAARLDVPGSLLAVAGLAGIVYGFSEASTDGWGAARTLGPIVAGVLLLTGFVFVERRVAHPLVPISILADRTRGGAYLGTLLGGVAAIGMFLLVTYYLQGVLGYSPLITGVAFLPFVGGAIVGANVVSNIALSRFGPRLVAPVGMVAAAVGVEWLARLGVHTGYGLGVAPGLALIGLGVSSVLTTAFSLGPAGTAPADTGVASALVNSGNQIGGSLGAALLNTIAANATVSYLSMHPTTPAAASVHGDGVAFTVLAGILVVGAMLTGAVHRPRQGQSASVRQAA
ncbi:MAG TPA: MFS transporter [Pseudonocardiaceae bacterium]|jgi:EmrB/QacA subfamily drug resistance transporter|nr:MFS transporter [Pseudonocardiaceae bacterium]